MRTVVAKHSAMLKEVRVLKKLHHRGIVRLYNAFIVDSSLVIVMEYASGGELKEYVTKKGRLDEEEAKGIFRQIVDAINHCHMLHVVHRDLKLENVLFSDQRYEHIKVPTFPQRRSSTSASLDWCRTTIQRRVRPAA